MPVLQENIAGFLPTSPLTWGVVFGLIFKGFNSRAWNWDIFRDIELVKVPDFNGKWTGYYATSSQDVPQSKIKQDCTVEGDLTPVKAELDIKQDWRNICVHFDPVTSSSSDSCAASILTQDGYWPSLTYQYKNEPYPESDEDMKTHDGTADLDLKQEDGKQVLEGHYYTGSSRESYGKLRFERMTEDS
ncbi:hypothetical protein [Haladaptatus salinisoli]|uniref:Cap15 family cyclic dinucleotide receptor domain-containing protein n=1 Tax=Haladaptatus salinisoli TaxID=2884876 RepID=UPI003F5F6C56